MKCCRETIFDSMHNSIYDPIRRIINSEVDYKDANQKIISETETILDRLVWINVRQNINDNVQLNIQNIIS